MMKRHVFAIWKNFAGLTGLFAPGVTQSKNPIALIAIACSVVVVVIRALLRQERFSPKPERLSVNGLQPCGISLAIKMG